MMTTTRKSCGGTTGYLAKYEILSKKLSWQVDCLACSRRKWAVTDSYSEAGQDQESGRTAGSGRGKVAHLAAGPVIFH